ncbi:hypothetical protein DFJ73DRAFT_808370 [Zopfochytrium polystomum]|nr:hypothetical protein DFJ73DRAFT_808370 [Zopfochytrium polystomum]
MILLRLPLLPTHMYIIPTQQQVHPAALGQPQSLPAVLAPVLFAGAVVVATLTIASPLALTYLWTHWNGPGTQEARLLSRCNEAVRSKRFAASFFLLTIPFSSSESTSTVSSRLSTMHLSSSACSCNDEIQPLIKPTDSSTSQALAACPSTSFVAVFPVKSQDTLVRIRVWSVLVVFATTIFLLAVSFELCIIVSPTFIDRSVLLALPIKDALLVLLLCQNSLSSVLILLAFDWCHRLHGGPRRRLLSRDKLGEVIGIVSAVLACALQLSDFLYWSNLPTRLGWTFARGTIVLLFTDSSERVPIWPAWKLLVVLFALASAGGCLWARTRYKWLLISLTLLLSTAIAYHGLDALPVGFQLGWWLSLSALLAMTEYHISTFGGFLPTYYDSPRSSHYGALAYEHS